MMDVAFSIFIGLVQALLSISLPIMLVQWIWLDKRRIWKDIELKHMMVQYEKGLLTGSQQYAAQSRKGRVRVI